MKYTPSANNKTINCIARTLYLTYNRLDFPSLRDRFESLPLNIATS